MAYRKATQLRYTILSLNSTTDFFERIIFMLTSKQRAYLRSYATKIDPVLMVGKGGATPEVVASANEALEARELIKGKVLDNCFENIRDIAHTIAERTRSDVVVVIGRKFVLFRQAKEKSAFEDLPKK